LRRKEMKVFPEMAQFVQAAYTYLVPPYGLATYYRDKKGCPRGLVVAFRDGEQVFVGWSMYNKTKEKMPFNKTLARAHAMRNARNLAEFDYQDTWDNIPHSLHRLVNEMVARAKNYFFKHQNRKKVIENKYNGKNWIV
jgi:hypothetical protein